MSRREDPHVMRQPGPGKFIRGWVVDRDGGVRVAVARWTVWPDGLFINHRGERVPFDPAIDVFVLRASRLPCGHYSLN